MSTITKDQIVKYYATLKNKIGSVCSTPESCYETLQDMALLEVEQCHVLLLDTHSRVIERLTVSIGDINGTEAGPRVVFSRACAIRACSVIVAHNHPSGLCEPSLEDYAITKRLVAAGKILGICLVDHIVIAGHTYESIRRNRPELFTDRKETIK